MRFDPKSPVTSLLTGGPGGSARGLDWFTFFVADIQTGFGPFLAVYLTTQKWNQSDIGLVLTMASIVGLATQLPGGWIVDVVHSKRAAARWSVAGIGVSAVLTAIVPSLLGVSFAKILHVASSAVLGPAIAAISLGLVGHGQVGDRLGRNSRFSSIGSGFAAILMGACGDFFSPQSVFFVTAALALPAILALRHIAERDIDEIRADGGLAPPVEPLSPLGIHVLLRKRSLRVLVLAVALFHTANAAMLPLLGTEMTKSSGLWASALVAACIVVPQVVAASIAPAVGRLASTIGRRPLLIAGFAALPARAALLAMFGNASVVLAIQILDGFCGAILGVLVPLILADISKGTGRFNLAQGIVATATGIGAASSTTLAGQLATSLGSAVAFQALAAAGLIAFLTVVFAMPETGSGDADEPPAALSGAT